MLTVQESGGPRARATDKLQSHKAADRSGQTLKGVKFGVLKVVRKYGALTGVEINDLYSDMDGVPHARWDSPRKRAGELVGDGFLWNIAGEGEDSIYILTYRARKLLAEAAVA